MPESSILFCGSICQLSAAAACDAVAGAAKCGLCPLAGFYTTTLRSLPAIQEISATEIPSPQRELLVHHADMTTTLETFYKARTHLRVLHSLTSQGVYQREVVLALDGTNRPVEFGAVTIQMALLASATQKAIVTARRPLGGLLIEHGVAFSSQPKAFIRLESDEVIAHALRLDKPATLYGRCNALLDVADRVVADIVEILPPVAKQNGGDLP